MHDPLLAKLIQSIRQYSPAIITRLQRRINLPTDAIIIVEWLRMAGDIRNKSRTAEGLEIVELPQRPMRALTEVEQALSTEFDISGNEED